MKKNGFTPILILLIIAIVGAVAFFAYKSAIPNIDTEPLPSINPSTNTDPNIGWKTYTNNKLGFTFKYPENYKIISQENNKIEIGFKLPGDTNPYTYLTIYANHITSSSLTNCVVNPEVLPCLDDKNGNYQKNILVDNKNAKNFYINRGIVDSYYRIVQFQDPKIEIQMNISGGGLEKTFDQILSTFKFTTEDYKCPENGWQNCMPILTEDGKKACSPEAIMWYKQNCPNYKGVAQ